MNHSLEPSTVNEAQPLVLVLAATTKPKVKGSPATVKLALEDGAGVVTFLLTITATTSGDTKTDLATYKLDTDEKKAIAKKYVRYLAAPQ